MEKVISGDSGSHVPGPLYEQVCMEMTGHARAIQLRFDAAVISKLLKIFFSSHHRTTKDRQEADVGPQYRSEIFLLQLRAASDRRASDPAPG